MAHPAESGEGPFFIIELKGRTAVESDFYDTFGQLFPIDDPEVTKGWTVRSVPKHGLGLRHANRLSRAWVNEARWPVALVVAIPDFAPRNVGPDIFFEGESQYYPKQTRAFREFVDSGRIEHQTVFGRLLNHLKSRYRLTELMTPESAVQFRFWGYQGICWVRDFATGRPVQLGRPSGPDLRVLTPD